jgi:hypothetical protein
MKYLIVLALLVSFIGCGAPLNSAPNVNNQPGQQGQQAPPPPPAPQAQLYDMLSWMTMDPSLAESHHMSGTANPVYTTVKSDRFFWTKSSKGFPWDIKLYDDKYIYTWGTELDWTNPNTFKIFHDPKLGDYNLPLVARFAEAGFPGSKITIPPSNSTYEVHTDCNIFTTKKLGGVVNTVWGPYTESLGGDLPDNLQTLIISYQYSCDSNLENCNDKEEYHVAKPYGLVKWQHQKLQTDGTYAAPDNVTYLNKLSTGQVTPVTTCF